jgi:hypothetical protein
VEYSLFMAVMMVLTSKRVEKRPGATPAAFPPPILAGIASVLCFSIASSQTVEGAGSLYRHFYVKLSIQGRRLTALEARGPNGLGWHNLAGAAPPCLVWPLGLISWTSCAIGASHGKILTPEKSQINLSLGRFLKHKSTQNRVNLFCRVITKIRRIDGKSP